MTKIKVPSVMCDHEDGCDQYAEDDYANGVSSVTFPDSTTWKPSSTEPARGWTRVGDEDFCPEHEADAMNKLDDRIDKLHGPGVAAALNQAIADGSIFGD